MTCSAPVHPHVRGAVSASAVAMSQGAGSSPRAWGGFERRHVVLAADRFIPTCVGRFLWIISTYSGLAVHPHVRGAVSRLGFSPLQPCGSSPRAWGG